MLLGTSSRDLSTAAVDDVTISKWESHVKVNYVNLPFVHD